MLNATIQEGVAPFYTALKKRQYGYVGFFKKPKGNSGALVANFLDELSVDLLVKLPALFVEIGHTKVPYRVQEISLLQHQAIVQLCLITSRTTAYALQNLPIFIPQSLLQKEFNLITPSGFLVGFLVKDILLGIIGVVQAISSNRDQYMIVVAYQNKELLIPYGKPFIIQVDDRQKVLTTQLPEGYIEAMF
ncbi:MAG: hypothetical protein K2X94_00475 [Amoebophilaceae bacterium]|nr:hypothetical protein [Amoebophilaceae bacterium]